MDDVASRYWGRPATSAEVDDALREDPSDDLAPPTGLFVIATVEGTPAGCGGVRLMPDGVAELTRVGSRRPRVASASAPSSSRISSGVRSTTAQPGCGWPPAGDLTEARAVYGRLGYHEVEPFNDEPYAEHWFGKAL